MTVKAPPPEKVKQVKIGGILYRVEYIERLLNQEKAVKLNGHILYNPCLIMVESENDEQMQKITVLHEILHGILTHAGIEDDFEKQVEILAYGLFGVIQDNPDLMDWIRGPGGGQP